MRGQISIDLIFALIAGLFLVLIINQVSTQILDSAEQNSILIHHTAILDKTTDLIVGKYLISDAFGLSGSTHDLNYPFSYPINCTIYLDIDRVRVVTRETESYRQLDFMYTTSISSYPFYCGGLFED